MDKLLIGIGAILLISGFVLLWWPNAAPAIQVQHITVPAYAILLILGLAAVFYPVSPFFKSSTPEPTPTASATPAPTATATPIPIAITSLASGAGVKVPFTVSGTAPDLGGDRLWLFTWSENATVPGKVYYPTSDAPIDVAGGFWDADVPALGAPGEEIGHIFILRLVRADSRCSGEIENIAPNSAGEFFVRQLPSGCTEAAPPLSVKKEA